MCDINFMHIAIFSVTIDYNFFIFLDSTIMKTLKPNNKNITISISGAEFSLHCVNHLLLPTFQAWLRRGSHQPSYWDNAAVANFKHCSGLCADLVVEYLIAFASESIVRVKCESQFTELVLRVSSQHPILNVNSQRQFSSDVSPHFVKM